MFQLTITSPSWEETTDHGSLVDARRALVNWQNRRGLWFTIDRSGHTGALRSGAHYFGRWAIAWNS